MNLSEYMPTPVKKTRIGNAEVSTIICYSGFAERRMAETMVFIDEGATIPGIEDQDGERDEVFAAESLHERWCRKIRAALNLAGEAA